MALYEKHDKVQLVNMSPVDRVHAKDTASVHLNGLHVMIESIHTKFAVNCVEQFYVVSPLKEQSLDDWRKYGFAAQISPADMSECDFEFMVRISQVQAICRDAASAELTRVAKESTRVGQAVRFNTASVERTRVVKARIAASGGCFFDYFIKSKKKTMPLKNHALGLNMKKILKTQGKGAAAITAKSAANRAKNVVEDTESETDFHTAVAEWLEEDIAAIMTKLALAEKEDIAAMMTELALAEKASLKA